MNFYYLLFILFFLNTSCQLNAPADTPATAGSSTTVNLVLIETLSTSPIVNSANQTQFPIHIKCPSNGLSGVVNETNTNFTCSASTAEIIINLNLSSLSEGKFTLSVQYSNGQTALSNEIVKDTINPDSSTFNLSFSGTTSYLYSSPILYFASATDGGSGVLKHQARVVNASDHGTIIDWKDVTSPFHFDTIQLLNGQSYYYELKAIDNAGNTSAIVASAHWTALGPILSITSPANNDTLDSASSNAYSFSGVCNNPGGPIVITVTDSANAHVIKNNITCGANVWSGQMDLSSLATGSLSVVINFHDISGNAATDATLTLSKIP